MDGDMKSFFLLSGSFFVCRKLPVRLFNNFISMKKKSFLILLWGMVVFALGTPVRGGETVESFGVDFGNPSSTVQEGWTNIAFTSTGAAGANTFVKIPLRRNGAGSSTFPVSAGVLFGKTVSLAVSAKSSVGNFNNLLSSNTLWTWQEGGFSRGTHASATPDSPSVFTFPNHCETFNTSGRLSSNGTPGASATARVSLSGLLPGKEYTVSFFLGSNALQYESVALVSGENVEVKALGTSAGSLNALTWTGAANAKSGDLYMAVEWKACADASGVLEFDIAKKAHASASGRLELNSMTVSTDDSEAPPVPEPRPASVVHNRALVALPSSVALPVPVDAWARTGEMTCELWIKPDEDASSGAILSLGGAVLSLNGGRLHLDSGNAEAPVSVEASGQPLAAGTWRHVAVSLGTENVSLYVDGTLAGTAPAAPYLASMKNGWAGLLLAAQFKGARDELRFWNAELGTDKDDFFLTGPLPMAHPRYDRLAGLWRLDGDFRDAKWTEFADRTGSPFARPYQAVTPPDTEFSIVTDNHTFRYMLMTAYVRDSHLRYRWLSRSHIINNNDLIYIGVTGLTADGTITYWRPDNDVREKNGVTFLPREGTRTSVYRFTGPNASMRVGGGLLGGNPAAFTMEASMLLSGERENFTLFGNDNVALTVSWAADHYRARIQVGTAKAWEADLPGIPLNEYFWIAFVRNNDTGTFYLNNVAVETGAAAVGNDLDGQTSNAVVGSNLVGSIDEMRIWMEARAAGRLGKAVQHAWADRQIVAYWGDSDVEDDDTASWVSDLRYLRELTAGVKGMHIRLCVAGGSDWKKMLGNEAARNKFAAQIAEMLAKYGDLLDGVDLDFEWLYRGDSLWNGYGELAKAIRQAIGPEPVFTITLHTVSYWFPKDKIQYVDFFPFQNYGPDTGAGTYNTMVSACQAFRSWGYPDSKIQLSGPFYGVTGVSGASDAQLYRDLKGEEELNNPALDQLTLNGNGKRYYYNGVDTTRKKNKYISDQKLAGFMYWDLGGDISDSRNESDYFDPRSLLRAANRYVSSTSFPVTASPFGLSRVGASVPAAGGAVDVEVHMEEEALGWVVAECPEWISVSASSGIGRTTVILTALENKSAAGRSGTVLFRASDKQECAVTVTQAGADLAGYDKWVQDSFPPDATADRTAADAAPAGDGITNLMKYATGLDPLKPCGSVTKVTAEKGADGNMHMVLRWPVNPQAAEVKHEVEFSPDMVNWSSLGEVETAGKTAAEFQDTAPVEESGMSRRFLRLKVTRE